MAADKIRVGIIGANAHYGWSMRAHLPALRAMPDYELMAVCTSRPETAAESAAHYGARLAFHDYHAMVRHPDIDLVSVSVRVPLHHAMVMAALHAGKHVYCEWPLGATLAEAEAMAALARAKGVRTMIGLQANGDPVVLRLRELLTEGYVGEVLSCTMAMFLPGLLQRGRDRAWMADRAMGAHTLSIATGHAIDVLCCCVADFQEVAALSTTQVPVWETAEPGKTVDVTAPDNMLISGVLTNGAVASVHVATVPWHGTGWRLEVYGREIIPAGVSDRSLIVRRGEPTGACCRHRSLSRPPSAAPDSALALSASSFLSKGPRRTRYTVRPACSRSVTLACMPSSSSLARCCSASSGVRKAPAWMK